MLGGVLAPRELHCRTAIIVVAFHILSVELEDLGFKTINLVFLCANSFRPDG